MGFTERDLLFLSNMPITVDEIMATVVGHEAEHILNTNANINFEPDYDKREELANRVQDLILIDKNLTVSYLENANTPFEKRSASVLVESTVYHEGTHYGNAKVNRNAHGRFRESGKEFERRAYGVGISVNNFRQYTRMQDRKALPPIQPLKPLPAYVK